MNNKLICSFLPLLAVSSGTASAADKVTQSNQNTEKKNVIFIITDDMRLDMLHYAGGLAKTPNLDALRNQSVDFANACTTTGLSSPSRAALFTGRLGHRTDLEDNLHLWHCQKMTLEKKHSTIYEWAHNKGYNVGYFGKWHVGYITPDKRGADQYVGSKGEQTMYKPKRPNFDRVSSYYDPEYALTEIDDHGKSKKGRKADKEKPDYYETLPTSYEKSEPKHQVDLGIKFLNEVQSDDRPFFLTVSFHFPHPPYRACEPWNKMYNYKDVKLPESFNNKKKGLEFQHDVLWPWMDLGHMSKEDWQKTISYSMGMVTMLDQALGELFQTIKDNGMWDNTLIVFTSDQGSMLAEHGLYDKGPYAYEGLMRIPMLIKAPGVGAKVVKHQVSLIDLNQTLVEYMALQPTDANLDSRSMIPLIQYGDEAWKDVPDEAFYRYEFYNGRWFGVRTIRTPKYKYSFNPCGDDELYDLESDPHEMVNLIKDKSRQAVVKDMRIRLLKHLKQCEDDHAFELLSGYTGVTLDEE